MFEINILAVPHQDNQDSIMKVIPQNEVDGSDSASQSFCQVIPYMTSKNLCSVPGTPVERVERARHF